MLKRMRKIMLILLSVLMLHSLLPVRIHADNNESTPSIVSNNEALFAKEGGLIFSIGIIGDGHYDVNRNGSGWLSDCDSSHTTSFDIVQSFEFIAKPAEGYSFKGWYVATVDKYNNVTGITDNLISTDNPYSTTLNSDLFIAAVFIEGVTVTFNTRGGTPIEPQKISSGSKATRPTDPTIQDIYFDDWYTDENFTTIFDFDTPLYNNITLYARWKYYTNVHPKGNNPNNGHAYIDTNTGGKWDKEKDTIKLTAYPAEGYRLKHWIDRDTKEILSTDNPFNYVVDKKRVIEAIFVEDKYTITFDSRGGTPVEAQSVNPGGKATKPQDPTNKPAGFVAWFIDEEFTNIYNFNNPVNEDITLYARWEYWLSLEPQKHSQKPQGYAYIGEDENLGGTWVHEANTVTLNATPKPGYAFVQWVDKDTKEVLSTDNPFNYVVEKEIYIVAEFMPKYEVIFDYNGQSFKGNNDYSFSFVSEEEKTISNIIDEYDDASVLYRQNIYPQIIINDDYYIVEGWYLEPECTNEFDIINDKLTNRTTTLYANWEKLSLDDYVLDETNTESYADVYFNGYINKDGNPLEVCFRYGGQANLLFEEQTNNEVEEILTQLRNIAPSVVDERGYRIAKPVSEEIVYEVDYEIDNSHSYYLDYSHKDANGNYVYSKNDKVRVIANPAKRVEVKYGDRYKRLMVFLNILVEPIPITKINILKDTHYLEVGGSDIALPFIEIEPEKASRSQLEYISSDTNVVTIDSEGDWGQFNGEAVGTATITVKAPNNISKTFKVVVKDKIIHVDSIKLNKNELILDLNKSETLNATISPSNATDKQVLWHSDNTKVATVDQNGKVTAKKIGTAIIEAVISDGEYNSSSCFVIVTQPIDNIKLNKTSLSLEPNQTETLVVAYSPTKDINPKLTWSSSDTSVAVVDSNGKITAKKAGTTTIKATTVNGKTATCEVTVKEVLATSIKLNKTSLSLDTGKSETLTATISPSNTTNKKVSWSSSNTSIATVDSNGKITGKKAGTVTITAKTSNNKSATCKVTVIQKATSISLNKTSLTLETNKSETLTVTITPSNTTNKKVSWSSSNTSIATVDSNGKITAKKVGNTTITAKTTDGSNLSATCKVTVKETSIKISLDKHEVILKPNESSKLKATISPATSNIELVWKSSDTSIATIDSNGNIKALKDNGGASASTVTISVSSKDGKYKDTCKVIVKDPIREFTRRLYKYCLNRNADKGGLDYYEEELKSGRLTAGNMVNNFFSSPEFVNAKHSNSELIRRAYLATLDRNGDAGGVKYYADKLENGVSNKHVLKGFVESPEFTNICKDYGVVRGNLELEEPRDLNYGVTSLVSRLYANVLGRKGDAGGLNYYTNQILAAANQKQKAKDLSYNFFASPEFKNKTMNDREYLTILYSTYLNRSAAESEYNYYLNAIKENRMTREIIMRNFSNSPEFNNILTSFGLK